MSRFNRIALGGLGGLMLLGSGLPGESANDDAIVLMRNNPALELHDGVLSLMGSPVTATLIEVHESGVLKRSEQWVAGRRHGSSTGWYSNAQMSELRVYGDGRKKGRHMGWYSDGTLRFDYRYERGVLEGSAREWYPSGVLYRDFNYLAGHESGSQRTWSIDGSLRANYVVRDGRRFGPIGSKGCTGEPVEVCNALRGAGGGFDASGGDGQGADGGGRVGELALVPSWAYDMIR